MSFEAALSYEQAAQALLLSSEDFIEGVASFVQKRDPEFRGR
jgi:enoyl-CoA hydratase/carnithine racemase